MEGVSSLSLTLNLTKLAMADKVIEDSCGENYQYYPTSVCNQWNRRASLSGLETPLPVESTKRIIL